MTFAFAERRSVRPSRRPFLLLLPRRRKKRRSSYKVRRLARVKNAKCLVQVGQVEFRRRGIKAGRCIRCCTILTKIYVTYKSCRNACLILFSLARFLIYRTSFFGFCIISPLRNSLRRSLRRQRVRFDTKPPTSDGSMNTTVLKQQGVP